MFLDQFSKTARGKNFRNSMPKNRITMGVLIMLLNIFRLSSKPPEAKILEMKALEICQNGFLKTLLSKHCLWTILPIYHHRRRRKFWKCIIAPESFYNGFLTFLLEYFQTFIQTAGGQNFGNESFRNVSEWISEDSIV